MRPFPWKVTLLIVLGIASSFADGVSLGLFLPLLSGVSNVSTHDSILSELPRVLEYNWLPQNEASPVLLISSLIIGAIILKHGLLFASFSIFFKLNSQISHQLRINFFDQLLRVSYLYFGQQNHGHLLNQMASETWRTSDALEIFVRLVISSSTASIYTIILLLLSWRMTLLVAVLLFLISSCVSFIVKPVESAGKEAVQANNQLSIRMCEGLSGMRTIRVFGQEGYEKRRFGKSSERVSQIFFKLNLLSLVSEPVYEILGAFGFLFILALSFGSGLMNLPSLIVFIIVLRRLQPQVRGLHKNYINLLSLSGSVGVVLAFLNPLDKPYTLSGCDPFVGFQEAIEFKKVNFQYSSDQELSIKNISLSIQCKKFTALVGPSGSGKSTLINLLFRFYEPSAGQIYVDQKPLSQFDTSSWRGAIAVVSQDIYLFSGTVYENICYGNLDANDSAILTAAKQAHAHDFIMQLPDGYQTLVGDRGTKLSGGQRQRIALARAMIRNPEILILDEATNSLDAKSEFIIQQELEKFCRGRTVICIAHRLSTIEKADKILVMRKGSIVEQGTLEHLLDKKGLFSELYQLQHHNALQNN